MLLPATIRVKLSSEAAEYVALTPVVVRDLPLLELIEHIASATGPDAQRIVEILKRGSIVSGATRFRWDGFEVQPDELAPLLTQLPGSDPARAFDASQCVACSICGPGVRIQIPREVAQRKRMLLRNSFWDKLLNTMNSFAYVSYIHKERADLYRVDVNPDVAAQVVQIAGLLRYSDLAAQIRAARITSIEFLVRRAGSGS